MFLNRSLRFDMLGGMLGGVWFWSMSRYSQEVRDETLSDESQAKNGLPI